jgi:hypothetical protein
MTAPILTAAELGALPNVWLSENPYSVGLIDNTNKLRTGEEN